MPETEILETREARHQARPYQAANPTCCCRGCARLQRRCATLEAAMVTSAIRVGKNPVNLMEDPLQWVCGGGHYWYAPISKIRDDGMICPHCPPPRDIVVCRARRILEHCWRPIEFEQKVIGGIEVCRYQPTSPETPFPSARPAFLQRAGIPARAQELDGYNEALRVAFEVVDDPDPLAEQLSQVKARRCRAHGVHLLVIPYGVEPGPHIRAQLREAGHHVHIDSKPIINRRTAADSVD